AAGIRRLTISNPAKRNALDHAILDALADAVREPGDARCLIITGEHGMFSSGYDIGDIPEDVFAVEAEKLVAHPFTPALDAIDAIGAPRTRELFLLGRNVDAATALSWGLVNRVVGESQLEETALDLAGELVANAPLSISGNKRVMRELLRAEGELDPGVEREL